MDQNIWKKPLVGRLHEHQAERLDGTFSQLKQCADSKYLALVKYLDKQPEKFYSKQVFTAFFDFLNDSLAKTPKRIISILNDTRLELNKAFSILDRVNKEKWHDDLKPDLEYEFMLFCDANLNTSYLKLVDGVYFHFIYIIASFITLSRGKSTAGLDLYSCVQIIKKGFPLFCEPYNHIVRNGIAHGGVTYKHFEIIYQDKHKNSVSIQGSELMDLADELIDLCNGMALALRIFYLQNIGKVNTPQQIMLEELQAQTNVPWWNIEGFLESQIQSSTQLVIFASPKTYDHPKVQYISLYSGVLCEELAPGYDRYFFYLRSPKILPGWVSFDGKKLRDVREKVATAFEDYIGVIDNDLVYIPKLRFPIPRLLRTIETYYYSFILHFPLAIDEAMNNLKRARFTYRNVKIHRTKMHLFLESWIVFDTQNHNDIQSVLRHSLRRMLRESLRRAKKKVNLFDRFFPLGFAKLHVYKSDYRRRKLINFGLSDDLICTVQVKRLKEVKLPDIKDSTIEIIGKYRIAWNKQWLDTL